MREQRKDIRQKTGSGYGLQVSLGILIGMVVTAVLGMAMYFSWFGYIFG